MISLFISPTFYILITIVFYVIFQLLYTKTKKAYFHPLILTGVILILYLFLISNLTNKNPIEHLTQYNDSLNIVNLMLGPLTVLLAVPIFKNWLTLKKYWLSILIATIVGSVVSILSVYFLGLVFNLDYTIIISLLPKSVTTAIAKEISFNINAIPELTIAAVIFTGVLGSILGPTLSKLFNFNDNVSCGLSFGVSSHAVGTSKAMELSEEIGAISSIAIVTTGILTMIILLFIK